MILMHIMGKQTKTKRKIWLLIWAVILTTLFILAARTFLIPINRKLFHLDRSSSVQLWSEEPNYIAAWDRSLTNTEVRFLIEGSRTGLFGGMRKFYHLLHHGDEPLVRRKLLDIANSPDLLNAAIGEFALFKLRDNPEERLQNALDIVVTGGLESEKLKFFSTGYEGVPDQYKQEVSDAANVIRKASFLFSSFVDPSEDIEYLPIIMEPFNQDYIHILWLIKIIGPFQGNPEVDEIVQEFQNEGVVLAGMGLEPFGDFIDNRFDSAGYELEIRQNKLWLKISHSIIALWIIAYIFYLRWRFRQIDLSESVLQPESEP